MVFVLVSEHTRKELDRLGVTEMVGADAYYESGDAMIAAYRERRKT
jgi:sulfate permease, SulP family